MTVNNVNLTARVTFEPKIKEFSNGGRLATVGVCWNNRYFNKTKDEWESIPNFFEVVVQNEKLIDRIANDLDVGNLIMIAGQLRYREWEQEGNKRSSVHIFAFDLLKCDILKAPDQEVKESNGSDSKSDDDVEF